ncbi:hypothetical protein QF030_000210 [Streptomyces rishiriensis]|uniref:Transposase n=1 Tax=Streptomyces rishiriensis TaxID=68264 RepID=A0ABU0NG01_STRRH|nr:hypothetical protein [Streptomyces rishiriensis]
MTSVGSPSIRVGGVRDGCYAHDGDKVTVTAHIAPTDAPEQDVAASRAQARVGARALGQVREHAVADRLGVEAHAVSRWRARFARDRLEDLTDESRPGRPQKITDGQVEEVVVKSLAATPKDATHYRADLADLGLKPHLVGTFKLSDPQFIEKVRDVVGLYLAPPEHALVRAWTRRYRSRPWTGQHLCCR